MSSIFSLRFSIEKLKFERERKQLLIEVIPSAFYEEQYLDGGLRYGGHSIAWCETENKWKNQIKN